MSRIQKDQDTSKIGENSGPKDHVAPISNGIWCQSMHPGSGNDFDCNNSNAPNIRARPISTQHSISYSFTCKRNEYSHPIASWKCFSRAWSCVGYKEDWDSSVFIEKQRRWGAVSGRFEATCTHWFLHRFCKVETTLKGMWISRPTLANNKDTISIGNVRRMVRK